MKDYSQFMTNKEAFIKNYEIVGNSIYVYFANTSERKPNIYDLTEENLKMLNKRLEEQYEILIQNNEKMMKSKLAKILMLLSLPFAIFGALGLANVGLDGAICINSLLISGGLITTGLITKIVKENKNFEEISTYAYYLDNKEVISKTKEKDENIERYISKEAKNLLEVQEQLQEEGLIEEVFNVNFMDNASLKDLKEIIHRLKIYQGLNEGQEYIDSKEEKTKTKTKTK